MMIITMKLIQLFNPLTAMFLSYRNQSVHLQSKSNDWFLHDGKTWSLMG